MSVFLYQCGKMSKENTVATDRNTGLSIYFSLFLT